MRGTDYYPEHPLWADEYDAALERWKERERLASGRDFTARPMVRAEYDAIYLGQQRSFNQWLAGQIQEQKLWTGISELDVKSLPDRDFDRPKLRPFKLPYETTDECRMRFRNTVIQIKGNPFLVTDIRQHKKEFWFLLEDNRDKRSMVKLLDIPDFRTCPPGYVQVDTDHVWMTRLPARQNQQGMNPQNTILRKISSSRNVPFSAKDLVEAVDSRDRVITWKKEFLDLLQNRMIPEFRLSADVAAFVKKGIDKVYIGYRGRMFGHLSKDNVVSVVDEDDLIQPFVKKRLDKVGLEITK